MNGMEGFQSLSPTFFLILLFYCSNPIIGDLRSYGDQNCSIDSLYVELFLEVGYFCSPCIESLL